jgi:hypothetical protein
MVAPSCKCVNFVLAGWHRHTQLIDCLEADGLVQRREGEACQP